ncbi:MAG: WecB/TagA/CpsF family glycosyltransferase [Chloroflexi bacterium]|nr:WecB/TagA/CpsF family glycosyltransferase [Chloroflexota bacterium]
MSTTPKHVNVLGVNVSAINMQIALDVIAGWAERREHHYVTITGVHGIMESQRDSAVRDMHNRAGLVTPDGMPLVWVSHRRGFRYVDRVYGPDLMLELCRVSATTGYRHFFYGGGDGVADLLASRLAAQFPHLNVVGTYTPPFRPLTAAEDEEIVQHINGSQADIVWVGLSTPKQEKWMSAHLGRLNATAMIGVGAAFDFHAGLKKQAPHWMQRRGLEWLFRLISEPRRLGRRYLINNPSFIFLILMQELGLRKYDSSKV